MTGQLRPKHQSWRRTEIHPRSGGNQSYFKPEKSRTINNPSTSTGPHLYIWTPSMQRSSGNVRPQGGWAVISHMGALLSLNNSIRVQRGRNLMTKRTRPRLLLGVLREEINSCRFWLFNGFKRSVHRCNTLIIKTSRKKNPTVYNYFQSVCNCKIQALSRKLNQQLPDSLRLYHHI